MEVPNRLSLALAEEDEHDNNNNERVCQKLNEWSIQVEFLCNPRPYHQNVKDDSTATAAATTSSPASSKSTTTTDITEKTDSPQSANISTLLVEKSRRRDEDPSTSSKSVVVLNTTFTLEEEEEELVVDDDSIVTNLSARLHYKLLQSLTPPLNNDHHHHHHHYGVVDVIPNNKTIQEFTQTQIAAWKSSMNNETTTTSPIFSPLLASILRASKNWIRWYLQIYSAKVKRRHIHIITNNNNNNNNHGKNNDDDDNDDDPIHRFKSRIMLDFYMDLLHYLIIFLPNHKNNNNNKQTKNEQQQHDEYAILARHVALLLFYATFDPIPPDITTNNMKDEQEQQQVTFFQNILNLLLHVDSIPLALALMRNVHNAAATLYHYDSSSSNKKNGAATLHAMARARVVVKKVTATNNNNDMLLPVVCCPWAPPLATPPRLLDQNKDIEKNGHENVHENEEEVTFTYLTLFCRMMAFCLRNQVPTPFPGNSSSSSNHHYSSVAASTILAAGGVVGDERAELVCEILRTLYASRIGHEQLIAVSSSEALQQLDQEEEQKQPHLHHLILDLLQLNHDDHNNNNNNNNGSNSKCDNDQKHRITECQLDSVSLLMDCGPGLMDYILASQPAVDALLSLLDRQVECVLEQCSALKSNSKNSSVYGGDASAMLTPILVVVHRFCQSSPSFRCQTFLSIFPASAEANYQRLVEAQEQQQRQQEGENQGDNTAISAITRPGRGGRTGGIVNNNKNKKKYKMNMSPLDAPVGTKRWRMIQLLTCVPQSSHVKRFTGELLWLLCNENPQDFTHRVGLGNALPILSVKGFAQLPSHTFS